MQILTKAIKEKLIANHKAQDGTKSFKAVLKLFNPTGIGTWYLSELNPENNNAFGLCCLHEEEFGYVNLDELLEVKGQFGLGIERDRLFTPKTFDECKQKENLNERGKVVYNNKPDPITSIKEYKIDEKGKRVLIPMTEEEEYKNAGITKAEINK